MVNDIIAFVKNIIIIEINSVIDNFVFFDCLLYNCYYIILVGNFKFVEVIFLCSIFVLLLRFIG